MKAVSVLFAGILLFSSSPVISGELSTLTKKEPVIIHGSTGASLNFHKSNESFAAQPPVDWNLYGNYSMQLFGIEMPFSFMINQFSQSYTHPFTQFGINPAYKWAKVHLGISNILLSQLTSAGHNFNGIGIELTPNKLRFSAFYGRLNLAGNDDTATFQYEKPEYSGVGYGVKLGAGSFDNYFDISYFHGEDDRSSSVHNTQNPFENEVIGMDFKVTLLKVSSLTGSFAVSGSTKNPPVAENDQKSSGKTSSGHKGIFSTYHSGNIPAWALESAFSIDLKNFRSLLSYRKVQPDFKSMGTPSSINDGQTISLTSGFSLAQGKLNINTSIILQNSTENSESAGELNAVLGIDNTYISGNLNIRRFSMKDIVTGAANQNDNLSASLNFNWVIPEKSTNFSMTTSYNRFAQTGISASSLGATVSAGAHLLKSKKLNLNSTMGYSFSNNNPGDSKGNITFSCNAGYHQAQNSFNFFVNYNIIPHDTRYSLIDYMPYKTTTHNLTAGISYTSSF